MENADQIFGGAEKRPRRQRWGCLGLGMQSIWIILLGVGIYYAWSSWQFQTKGEQVDAVVISLEENSDDDGTTYSPVFEYRFRGQTYTYESVNSSYPPSHDVGERATLLVDPKKPTRARENSFWELWLLPVIMIPVSAATGVGINLAMLFGRRRSG